jgi:hypothetical protein
MPLSGYRKNRNLLIPDCPLFRDVPVRFFLQE